MRKVAVVLLLVAIMAEVSWAGLGSEGTMYVGGTVSTIKDGTEGRSSAKDEKAFTFEYKGGTFTLPYDRIESLEYGQKAGRRVGVAIAVTWVALFSKKRRHFLTIGYKDEAGKEQAAVFELGKNVVRVELAQLEARTGKKIDYEDEEARKAGRN